MATTERVMTADELWRLPRDGWRRWLVAGRLAEIAPAGDDHGRYAGVLAALAGYHVLRHKLGAVYAAETGFLLAEAPDTVQAPDWAFVRRERVRPLAGGRRRAGRSNYFPGHPGTWPSRCCRRATARRRWLRRFSPGCVTARRWCWC